MKRPRAILLAPGLALAFLLAGLAARLVGSPTSANLLWLAGLLLVGLPVIWGTIRQAMRGRFATDIVATLAIVGALLLREPFAGLIIVLMQTGGEALERYAEGKASRAIHDLEQQAPRIAHRVRGEVIDDLPVERVAVGDILLVRPGELVPCNGVVSSGRPHLDMSRLTGEPLPLAFDTGTKVRSGGHNLDSPFEFRVTAVAQESEYARIVELVRSAQASKAPLQRLADRYAVWFTPLTLVACTITFVLFHDWTRVLAVLVVATPCPLILATPVAIVGGLSRAASRGIVFRHGSALEQLATTSIAIFDKTGTLTIGRPEVESVQATEGFAADEVLGLAAAVERGSGHLLALTLIEHAASRALSVHEARDTVEAPGQGISGMVDGRRVAVGGWQWITTLAPLAKADLETLAERATTTGLKAFIAIDGRGAGVVTYADRLRPDMSAMITELRALGIGRMLLLSGDRLKNVEAISRQIGIEEVQGDLSPGDKTAVVQALVKGGESVLMLGDGTNDAPALTAATVGIALASGGGGIAAEAADAVILTNDPNRVVEAIVISRRTLRIAHQSIWNGLGLSALAMVAASLGYLPPAVGAMVQEAIDVAVILNALRAASGEGHQAASTPAGS